MSEVPVGVDEARPMGRVTFGLLLMAMLAVASAYGVLLLLPLYLKQLGGNEATFGALTAAAVLPAAVVLGVLLRFPGTIRPSVLLATASLIYAGGAAGLAMIGSIGLVLVGLALLLGATWAVIYTVGPMVVDEHVGDTGRAAYIGYVTGTVQLGFGLGPVLGGWLHGRGLTYPAVFLVGAGLAAVATGLVALLATRLPRRPLHPPTATAEHPLRLLPAMAGILRSPAATPLVMILLMACLFTAMNSFQTTFAQSRGLSFDVFYVSYTTAVIVVRLVVARALRDSAVDRVVIASTIGISVAVLAFLAVGANPLLYAAASALLGGAYGLALPAMQARAVNFAPTADRRRMLPLAGLLFQIAILGFPLVAGAVITAFGYRVLFAVLFCFAVAVSLLGLRRSPTSRAAARRPSVAMHQQRSNT
jgi:MFS family permease